jgi:DNA-binding LacI/PurR family transcriptional regulator
MSKPRVTIAHVAERANVSYSTVSRVMNDGVASPQVRDRVREAAKELGYKPSSIARNFKLGRQGCIGVIVESSVGSWFAQVLSGIEEALAEETGSALMLGSLVLRAHYDSSVVETWISERRIDGLIFARCTGREGHLVAQASEEQIPMVFVAPDEHFGAGPVFVSGNRRGARDLAQHLLAFGHRRFGFLGGPRDSTDILDRLRGLGEELASRELAIEEANLCFSGNYAPDGAVGFAERWLTTPRNDAPTAVVCANDALAIAFLRTVLQRGARVPEDLSVVGFDGVPEGALYWPGLTSAQQRSSDLGAAACRTLLRMIEDPPRLPEMRTEMPMDLVVRESSGPAPS